ncbi:MAG TPA: efflux RND transporter permease subunit [Flavobacteriaceae bacterium]|nr:efflux RND transporter permease subunit [Flavobacteriaceae bacterium]
MKLAEISIKRPTLVVVLFTLLTLGGLFSYSQLGYELIPKFEINVVSVTTVYPGASPSEVENTVTKKIEDAVSTLENVKKIESKSFESLSFVMVTLNDGANADLSLNDAQRKINAILKDLPDDVDPPSLSKFSLDDLPILTIGATADMDDVTFYDLLDKKIQPILSRVDGVAQVNLVGGQEREIQVSLDPKKLQGYDISIPDVQRAVVSSNLDFPTGNIKTRENSTLIRLSGKYRDVEELRNLVISNEDGIQIRLRDVAEVQDTQKEVNKVARINRKSAILLQVLKQTDANAVAVSEGIHKVAKQLQQDYKNEGVVLEIVDDTTDFTLAAANSVMKDLIIAIMLVAFVCLFFLHSFRNALIVMITIPASLIATFIGIFMLGYTLNLMSLLGLSLVIGILVDDAIVVIENIHRHLEMGKNRARAAYDGAKEIGFTVTAITLVIVVVFFPIAISTGLVSNIITQFCMTVVIATLMSLLSSFTIVPWLFSRFGKLENITGRSLFGKIILGFENVLEKITHRVSSTLKWCLNHKITTIVVVFFVFVGSIGLLAGGFIGGEFFARMDRGEFMVQLELPKDASVEQTNFMTQKAEEYLAGKKEVVQLISTVGQSSDGWGGAQGSAYKSEIKVVLNDKKEREDNSFVYAAKTKRELQEVLVGAKVKTVPVGMFGADQAPLMLTVTGPELEDVMKFAEQAADSLRKISGATEVKLSSEAGNPEINVQVDRDKMASLGLDLMTVGMTMQTAFSGNTDAKFRAGEYEYDINIRYSEFDRSNIHDVSELVFVNNNSQQIKLSQFATITETSGPSLLERRDKSPSVNIESQTVGRPTGTIAAEWEAIFSKMERPSGVNYVWGSDMENQTEGFGTLGYALLAAIILVYLVMVALYNSYITPFVVLFSVPLSFIGALTALALTNNSLNVFTILGIIMLIGLVAKNAILLVDFANHRKEAGETTFNALVQANHARLRPILMTTLAMVFGMLPIALASGAAAEMNNGLAWVVIGGLISSLLLTLVIVPVVYSIFDTIVTWFQKGKTQTDYPAMMTADYTPRELSEDGFTPKH